MAAHAFITPELYYTTCKVVNLTLHGMTFTIQHDTQHLYHAAVMTALKKAATWDEAKKVMGEAGFMERLLRFDKDTLDDALLRKLAKFTGNKDFTPESVGKVSGAAKGMCLWVHAMKVRVIPKLPFPAKV